MTGHSAHDDAGYVSSELFEEWQRKDPIGRYEHLVLEEGILSRAEIDEMQRRIVSEVDAGVEWAENNPFPDPHETLRGVYHEGD
jgi:TPP-dependent pyruvate/acetoin dehydrogenase alpha subunit